MTWIQNTWRSSRLSKPQSALLTKTKRNEVVWRLWPERVWAEMSSLLGVEKVDTMTPGWLAKHLTALKNVKDRLTTSEIKELEAERDRLAVQGNSEEKKRRLVLIRGRCRVFTQSCRLAEKNWMRQLNKDSKTHWLQMGLLSITFVSRTTPGGQLAIEV